MTRAYVGSHWRPFWSLLAAGAAQIALGWLLGPIRTGDDALADLGDES